MSRAILFDLYDTLIYLDKEMYLSWHKEMARRLGVDPEVLQQAWRNLAHERFLGKILTLHETLRRVACGLRMEIREDEIEELARREMETLLSCAHLYPLVPESLRRLREMGYGLALVSNASSATRDVLEFLNLLPFFDHIVLSCDVGSMKPDPNIYQEAMERLGVGPEECIFVGDGGSRELDGARTLGIRAVRIIQEKQDKSFGVSKHWDLMIRSLSELIELLEADHARQRGGFKG